LSAAGGATIDTDFGRLVHGGTAHADLIWPAAVSVNCGIRVDDGLVSMSATWEETRNHDRSGEGNAEVAGR